MEMLSGKVYLPSSPKFGLLNDELSKQDDFEPITWQDTTRNTIRNPEEQSSRTITTTSTADDTTDLILGEDALQLLSTAVFDQTEDLAYDASTVVSENCSRNETIASAGSNHHFAAEIFSNELSEIITDDDPWSRAMSTMRDLSSSFDTSIQEDKIQRQETCTQGMTTTNLRSSTVRLPSQQVGGLPSGRVGGDTRKNCFDIPQNDQTTKRSRTTTECSMHHTGSEKADSAPTFLAPANKLYTLQEYNELAEKLKRDSDLLQQASPVVQYPTRKRKRLKCQQGDAQDDTALISSDASYSSDSSISLPGDNVEVFSNQIRLFMNDQFVGKRKHESPKIPTGVTQKEDPIPHHIVVTPQECCDSTYTTKKVVTQAIDLLACPPDVVSIEHGKNEQSSSASVPALQRLQASVAQSDLTGQKLCKVKICDSQKHMLHPTRIDNFLSILDASASTRRKIAGF